MYWDEAKGDDNSVVPDDIVDLVYNIKCRCLPVDHAYFLSQAIHEALPWFGEESDTAMHTIHVAESANGWIRPEGPDALLFPSRRTKMTLRVPKHRIQDAEKLLGKKIEVDGHDIELSKMVTRPLSPLTTIFSRYIVGSSSGGEEQFMEYMVEQMRKINVRPKKMLCGIERFIHTPDGDIETRSLMLADLTFNESVILQQKGLGEHRRMGCGIFLPHKDIAEISEDQG